MPGFAKPSQMLSVADAAAIVVGMVPGVGIFKTPSIMAASAGNIDVTRLPVQRILMVWIFRRNSLNLSLVVSLMDSSRTTTALL